MNEKDVLYDIAVNAVRCSIRRTPSASTAAYHICHALYAQYSGWLPDTELPDDEGFEGLYEKAAHINRISPATVYTALGTGLAALSDLSERDRQGVYTLNTVFNFLHLITAEIVEHLSPVDQTIAQPELPLDLTTKVGE